MANDEPCTFLADRRYHVDRRHLPARTGIVIVIVIALPTLDAIRRFSLSEARCDPLPRVTPWKSPNRPRSDRSALRAARPSNKTRPPGGFSGRTLGPNGSFQARQGTGAPGHFRTLAREEDHVANDRFQSRADAAQLLLAETNSGNRSLKDLRRRASIDASWSVRWSRGEGSMPTQTGPSQV